MWRWGRSKKPRRPTNERNGCCGECRPRRLRQARRAAFRSSTGRNGCHGPATLGCLRQWAVGSRQWAEGRLNMSSDPIIAALEDLVSCYRRLGKLAQVQHEYVEREQTEELLGLLSLRQEVL